MCIEIILFYKKIKKSNILLANYGLYNINFNKNKDREVIKRILILIIIQILIAGCVGTMKIADKPQDETRGIVTKAKP
jgi:hypothetical protein